MGVRRGRPPKAKKLVPLMVMVDPDVKSYLQRCADAMNKNLSEQVREVLNHFYATR